MINVLVMDVLNNIWFYISIGEFVVIASLLIVILKNKKRKHGKKINKKDLLNSSEDVDFGGVIQSSFHAKGLYDTLIRKCHPDRYIDEKRRQIASELSSQIVENKHNYKKLCELKEIAVVKLNIKID